MTSLLNSMFQGSDRQLNSFLTSLNSVHNNIKVTLKIENDKKQLNFLDLTITRNDNSFKFNVYRKPIFTDSTIPTDSYHPITCKLATYNSMIYRPVSSLLSQTAKLREFQIITQTAVSNGFLKSLIKKLIYEMSCRAVINQIFPINPVAKETHYAAIPFADTISQKISNVFNKINIKIAFFPNLTRRKLVYNAKEKTDSSKKSEVYKIDCTSCIACYVRQTGRCFEQKFK